MIGLALDPERNPSPGWCALVVSLRYCYDHWEHILRAYNKSLAAARQEREPVVKRRDQAEEPEGGVSQKVKIYELEG